jgi:hypothetical protein
VVDERPIADVNLLAPQERRHRNDDGEFLQRSLKIVGHRHHRSVAVANENDLRGLVEQFRIGLSDVEAAEAKQGRRRPRHDRRERRGEHESSPHSVAPCEMSMRTALPGAADRSAARPASTLRATRATRSF